MIKRKSCFKCKCKLPLILFHTDYSKYQIKSAMGKTAECRRCAYKRIKEDKGVMQRVDNKFVFVPMGRIETIKYIFKK